MGRRIIILEGIQTLIISLLRSGYLDAQNNYVTLVFTLQRSTQIVELGLPVL